MCQSCRTAQKAQEEIPTHRRGLGLQALWKKIRTFIKRKGGGVHDENKIDDIVNKTLQQEEKDEEKEEQGEKKLFEEEC